MLHHELAARHQAYPAEMLGDTLILQPRGDAAGFSLSVLSTEYARIFDLLKSGIARHLLIDLGSDRYFGSMVIGNLVQLAELVRSRGGRTAVCELHDDMATVLRLMNLDRSWEQFRTRADAIHAMTTIPLKERLWRYRYVFATVCAAAVLVITILLIPARKDHADKYLAELQDVLQQSREERAQASVDEWPIARERILNGLEPLLTQIEQATKSTRDERSVTLRTLLEAGRDCRFMLTNDHPATVQAYAIKAQYGLDVARAAISGEELPPPLAPVPHESEIEQTSL